MKRTDKLGIFTGVVACGLVATAMAFPSSGSVKSDEPMLKRHHEGIYADCGVVTYYDIESDYVEVTMQNGNVFSFISDDWNVGELTAMLMYDNGTPDVTDDVILSVKYTGWISEEEMKCWVK